MSWKDNIVDAFEDWLGEERTFEKVGKEEYQRLYEQFEKEYLEGQVAQAEARENR